jgi:chromosomal replication initiation ATPase DnaA
MASQLVLELPHIPSLDGEDFLVSASNEKAARLVQSWPDWAGPVCIIAGPEGSGKTHLINVWRGLAGANAYPAGAIAQAIGAVLETPGPVAIEDIDAGSIDEHAAFHLLNLARERRFDVLITGRTAPGLWDISLPDLRSRLRSAALVEIDEPDEVLLRAVLVKLFADRQLSIVPEVIDYIITRMERSMAGAASVVDALDRAALAERKAVTRPLAAKVLGDGRWAGGRPKSPR